MTDASDLRLKAETCVRLAGTVSSIRTLELFKALADEYWAQADAIESPGGSPPLAPVTSADLWIAELKALRDKL